MKNQTILVIAVVILGVFIIFQTFKPQMSWQNGGGSWQNQNWHQTAPPANPPAAPSTPPLAAPPKGLAGAFFDAKRSNKQVFLFCSKPGCDHCTHMKKTLENEKVKQELQKYVVYMTDASTDNTANLYFVQNFPSYFVLDQEGKIVKKGVGAKEPVGFLRWLDS